jgi:hypothetical protein
LAAFSAVLSKLSPFDAPSLRRDSETGTVLAAIQGGTMFHLQLFKTLSALAAAGFNPRAYLLSIALGNTVTDHREVKLPPRAAR